jgi:hypothetical protein
MAGRLEEDPARIKWRLKKNSSRDTKEFLSRPGCGHFLLEAGSQRLRALKIKTQTSRSPVRNQAGLFPADQPMPTLTTFGFVAFLWQTPPILPVIPSNKRLLSNNLPR